MATRFWVGGSGNWSDGASHWAASSGGAPAASNTPTHLDDVRFDANSFSGAGQTVTVDKPALVKSMDWTGATNSPTLAGSQNILVFEGNVTFIAAMTASWTGNLVLRGSGTMTLTTNGLTLSGVASIGFGNAQYQSGTYVLQDALSAPAATFGVTAGTLNTNGQTVTVAAVDNTTALTRTLTLGASTINCGSWDNSETLGLTFNCGTSTINMTGAATFNGGGLTYYDVNLTDTTALSTTNGTLATAAIIAGANTFHNLSRTNTSGYVGLRLDANQTVTNALTLTGNNASTQRLYVGSSALGTARTITCNGAVTLTNVDLEDFTGAGSASFTGTSVGNCGGNSGVTFTIAVSCYWVHPAGASANWTDANWYTASGGAVAARVPLPQDDALFDASSFGAAGKTVLLTFTNLRIGKNVNWTGVTNTPTFDWTAMGPKLYGSLTFVSGMTFTATSSGSTAYCGRGSFTITTGGKTMQGFSFVAPGGTYTLQDNFTASTFACSLRAGTLTTNDKSLTCGAFTSATYTRTLNLGASAVSVSGNWTVTEASTFTLNAGTSTITVTASSLTFTGGGLTYYNLTNSQAIFTIAGANTFNNLTHTPGAVVTGSLTLSANQTVTGALTVTGNSAALNRTLVTSDTLGTARTITCAGTVALTNVDFRDVTAAGGAAGWGTGTSIGDCGGNTGITVTPAVTRYWRATSGGNWGTTGSWSTTSGGATGASVPLPHDTAIIDASSITSGSRTITANMPRLCTTIDFSAVTNNPAFVATVGTTIFGSLTFGTMTNTSNGSSINLQPRANASLTTAGVVINQPLVLNGTATLTLVDALTLLSSRTLTLTQGTLNLNSKAVSIGLFSSSNSNTRALAFGTSTLTLTGVGTVWNVSTDTGMTLSAGTGKIVMNDASASAKTFTGSNSGLLTYYDLQITGAGTGTFTMNGCQTFHTITVDTGPKTVIWTSGSRCSACTNLTATGTAGNLITFQSSAAGAAYKFTVSGTLTMDYCAVSDMVVKAGSSAITHLTDSGNNYGLGTDAPRYWVAGGNGYWDDTSNWSASSGGASGASVPINCDVYVDANSGTGLMNGFSSAGNGLQTHDFVCTGALVTFIHSTNFVFAGSTVALVNRWVGFNTFFFRGIEAACNLTTNGTTIGAVNLDCPILSKLTAQDDLMLQPQSTLSLTGGAFDANGRNVEAGRVNGSGSGVRSITMGSGTWTIRAQATSSTTAWDMTTTTNLTFAANTSTIVVNPSVTGGTPTSRSFAAGGLTYNNVTVAGPSGGELVFASTGSTYNAFKVTVAPYTLTFGAGTTRTVSSLYLHGVAGSLITLRSDTAGTAWTISKAAGTVHATYVALSDSTAAGGAAFYAGTGSTNGGGNTGWTFADPTGTTASATGAGTAARALNVGLPRSATGTGTAARSFGIGLSRSATGVGTAARTLAIALSSRSATGTGVATASYTIAIGVRFVAVARSFTFAAVARAFTFLGVARQ